MPGAGRTPVEKIQKGSVLVAFSAAVGVSVAAAGEDRAQRIQISGGNVAAAHALEVAGDGGFDGNGFGSSRQVASAGMGDFRIEAFEDTMRLLAGLGKAGSASGLLPGLAFAGLGVDPLGAGAVIEVGADQGAAVVVSYSYKVPNSSLKKGFESQDRQAALPQDGRASMLSFSLPFCK